MPYVLYKSLCQCDSRFDCTDRKRCSGFRKYVTVEVLIKTVVRKSICKSKNFHIVSPCSAANCIYYVTRSIGLAGSGRVESSVPKWKRSVRWSGQARARCHNQYCRSTHSPRTERAGLAGRWGESLCWQRPTRHFTSLYSQYAINMCSILPTVLVLTGRLTRFFEQ